MSHHYQFSRTFHTLYFYFLGGCVLLFFDYFSLDRLKRTRKPWRRPKHLPQQSELRSKPPLQKPSKRSALSMPLHWRPLQPSTRAQLTPGCPTWRSNMRRHWRRRKLTIRQTWRPLRRSWRGSWRPRGPRQRNWPISTPPPRPA